MRIGEVAEKVGVSVDTLRYYERLGVLPRAHRTTGGFRSYGDEVIKRMKFIQQAQALGLTLKDVRQLIVDQGRPGRDRCRKVRYLLAVRLDDVDQKLAELRDFRRTLRSHLDACAKALEAQSPTCPVMEELKQ